MTNSELIPADILQRKAVVYVRQSSQSQVLTNLESQRLQYDLVKIARQRGFVDIEVIDDDLGRSASGTVARPGFDRLPGCYVLVKWGRFCAPMPRGSRAMGETGIICSNCVGWLTHVSSIPTTCMILDGRTTGFSWE